MEKKEKLTKRLKEAKKFLENKGFKVPFIAVYWSQNYGLDEYSNEYLSDIDMKAIILPSLDELINNSKPFSTVYDFKDGQIDVKDIRKFIETLVKSNPAYIETLFSDYHISSSLVKEIIKRKEKLVEELAPLFIKASYGMILEKNKAFSHPYPSIKDKIEKYGYDPKQLHHIIRLYYLIKNYDENKKLIFKNEKEITEELMKIKKGYYSLKEAKELRDEYTEKAKKIREKYEIPLSNLKTKAEVINLSKKIIKENIIEEIKNNF